jgi:hypothetical protein
MKVNILTILFVGLITIIVSTQHNVFSSIVKADGHTSNTQKRFLCRSAIAVVMGQKLEIIQSSGRKDGLIEVSYERPSDGKLWQYACKIDGNRVLWASLSPDGSTGRWRDGSMDPTITFQVTDDKVIMTEKYFDGSSTSKEFTPDDG